MADEVQGNDNRCHLLGSTRLVNAMAAFASNGGLGEAASWLSLRQDLYVALTSNAPLNVHLDNYELYQSFYSNDDTAWANRMIHIYARILSAAFRATPDINKAEWDELDNATKEWHDQRPEHFNPILEQDSSPSSNVPFPTVQLLQAAHVVGMQYSHMAKILLAIYDPRIPKLGFGAVQARRKSEVGPSQKLLLSGGRKLTRLQAILLQHLRMVIGIAISNEHVQMATFEASHILYACKVYSLLFVSYSNIYQVAHSSRTNLFEPRQ